MEIVPFFDCRKGGNITEYPKLLLSVVNGKPPGLLLDESLLMFDLLKPGPCGAF